MKLHPLSQFCSPSASAAAPAPAPPGRVGPGPGVFPRLCGDMKSSPSSSSGMAASAWRRFFSSRAFRRRARAASRSGSSGRELRRLRAETLLAGPVTSDRPARSSRASTIESPSASTTRVNRILSFFSPGSALSSLFSPPRTVVGEPARVDAPSPAPAASAASCVLAAAYMTVRMDLRLMTMS